MTTSAILSLGYVAVYVGLAGVASFIEKPAGRGVGAFQLNALGRARGGAVALTLLGATLLALSTGRFKRKFRSFQRHDRWSSPLLHCRAVDDPTAITPDRCAALVAPQIERLTFAVIHASIARAGQRLMTYGVPPDAIDIVGQLRTGLAARPVSAAGLAAIYRYRDADQVRRNLDTLVSAGIIEQTGDGAIVATRTGHDLLTVMYESGAEATAELWSAHRETVADLSELAGRLVAAAAASGGDAYGAVAPPYEPPGASPGLLLHHRLAVLRYHRADAHAAAWQAAGHTVDTIRGLADGPERELIETETNRRAGQPYAALGAAERPRLASGLTDLPGEP